MQMYLRKNKRHSEKYQNILSSERSEDKNKVANKTPTIKSLEEVDFIAISLNSHQELFHLRNHALYINHLLSKSSLSMKISS